MIDSSVLIAAKQGRLDWAEVMKSLPEDEPVAISAIAAFPELLHGVHRAATAEQRAKREAFVERLLATLPVLAFDVLAARTHARLWADLAARGENIGAHDLLIAATALASGFAVATRDERSFPKVPGLSLVRI